VQDVPPKLSDRLRASELLGKSEADFTDKLGVGGINPDGEITEIPILFVAPPKREEEELPEHLPLEFSHGLFVDKTSKMSPVDLHLLTGAGLKPDKGGAILLLPSQFF